MVQVYYAKAIYLSNLDGLEITCSVQSSHLSAGQQKMYSKFNIIKYFHLYTIYPSSKLPVTTFQSANCSVKNVHH